MSNNPTKYEVFTLNSGQQSFSRLLNSDWSIQISGAAAVCKDMLRASKKATDRGLLSYLKIGFSYCRLNKYGG